MKIRVLLFAFLLAGLSSCAYKTCPTYAKQDVKPEVKTETKARI